MDSIPQSVTMLEARLDRIEARLAVLERATISEHARNVDADIESRISALEAQAGRTETAARNARWFQAAVNAREFDRMVKARQEDW